MIGAIIAEFGSWIVAAIGFIGTIGGVYFVGKKSQEIKQIKRENELKEQQTAAITEEIKKAADRRISAFQGLNDVQTEIGNSSDTAVTDKLRSDWTRD